MPLTKSAIKKMRQDERKKIVNKKLLLNLKKVTKEAKENSTLELVRKAFSILDKAAKRGLIHKNTVSRKKSSLAKMLQSKSTKISKSQRKDNTKS